MESQRSIERKYKKLQNDVATKDFYKVNLTNRVNCYKCKECGHITKTKDVDAGVTPFMHTCENCSEMAYSTMYNDIAPHKEPTEEWYRPSLQETLNYRKKEYGESMLEHIFNGGLEVRKIKPKH